MSNIPNQPRPARAAPRRTRPAPNGEYSVELCDAEDRRLRRWNLPEEERLFVLLRRAITAAEDLQAAHGEACDCYLCHDVSGLLYNLNFGENCVGNEIMQPFHEEAVPCPVCQPFAEDEDSADDAREPTATTAAPAAPQPQEARGFSVRFLGRRVRFSFVAGGEAE